MHTVDIGTIDQPPNYYFENQYDTSSVDHKANAGPSVQVSDPKTVDLPTPTRPQHNQESSVEESPLRSCHRDGFASDGIGGSGSDSVEGDGGGSRRERTLLWIIVFLNTVGLLLVIWFIFNG